MLASERQLVVGPTTLGPDGHERVGRGERSPAWFGHHCVRQDARCVERAGHLHPPDPPALAQGFVGDPPQTGQLLVGPLFVPPHDGMLRVQQHHLAGPQLGRLLNEPVDAISFRNRRGEAHRIGAGLVVDLCRRSEQQTVAVVLNPREQPVPRTVGDRHLRPVGQADHSAEVVLHLVGQPDRPGVGQLVGLDEHVRGGSAPCLHPGGRGAAHEKADLIREKRPSLPLPTSSPRPSAYLVRRSTSVSESLVGTSTRTRTRRSPRPRPFKRGTP